MRTNKQLKASAVIARLESGDFDKEVGKQIREAITSLRKYGTNKSKTSVTITLTFLQLGPDALTTQGSVTRKEVQRPSPQDVLYHDMDGNLMTDDPKRLEMAETE